MDQYTGIFRWIYWRPISQNGIQIAIFQSRDRLTPVGSGPKGFLPSTKATSTERRSKLQYITVVARSFNSFRLFVRSVCAEQTNVHAVPLDWQFSTLFSTFF